MIATTIEDDDHRLFYIAIGEALSEFSSLEHALCNCFCVSMGTGLNNIPAYRAFWAIAAFEGKLKMTTTAVREIIKPSAEVCARWDKLTKQVRGKNKTRNEIAHGTLVSYTDDKCSAVRLMKYYYSNSINDSGPIPLQSDYMTLGQIQNARCAFRLTRNKLIEFAAEVQNLLKSRKA